MKTDVKTEPRRRVVLPCGLERAVLQAAVGVLAAVASLGAQDDFSGLRINEVISDNESQPPADKKGAFQDLVEIYNSSDARMSLSSLALSDTPDATPPNDTHLKAFPSGTNVEPKGFVVVMLSSDKDVSGDCQTEFDLGLAKDGSEPVTLWGPRGTDGKRQILDQVWLPPLPADVSFGRYPDGAGPAPVPVAETFQHFRFFPPGSTTFGVCGTGACSTFEAPCKGAPNGTGGNIAPSVNRVSHSTNHPGAGEAVRITVSVEDDQEPTPDVIASVRIQYAVNGAEPLDVELEYDASSGVQTGAADGKPLKRWTLWAGSIPGQVSGARVDFKLRVEDKGGLSGLDPKNLCTSGIGPCDKLGLPGPGCVKEPDPSLQFVSCDVPFRYTVGYEAGESVQGLLINEVMATQTKTLKDGSDYDDYIELFNSSSSAIELSGLWLSDKPFQPQGWPFPAGSKIDAGQHLLVWTDADGGQCPRPPHKSGDGQECPDPTDATKGLFHTNFALETGGDQIYIFDRAENGYGVIHGVEFGAQTADVALALIPDGQRSGEFKAMPGTPGATNEADVGSPFRRGDSNGDCGANLADAIFTLRFLFQGGEAPKCLDASDVDDNGSVQVTDAIYLLNYLFQGGASILPPGESTPGPDPTDDELGTCEDTGCTG